MATSTIAIAPYLEVDPSHTSEEAVFADGSRRWWNSALNAWETGPDETGADEGVAVLVNGDRLSSPRDSGGAPTPQVDAITMLQADHRKVQELFARYQCTRDRTTKQQIVEQVFTVLDLHAQLEETVFYPAFDTQIGKKGTQQRGSDHRSLMFVAELALPSRFESKPGVGLLPGIRPRRATAQLWRSAAGLLIVPGL